MPLGAAIEELNLLKNHLFEQLSESESEEPEHWERYYTGTVPDFEYKTDIDTDETDYTIYPHTRRSFVKVDGSASGMTAAGYRYRFKIRVDASTEYVAVAYVKTFFSTGTVAVKVEWFDSSDATISTSTGNTVSGETDWIRTEVSVTSPANAKYAYVKIEATATGIFWIDSCAFFEAVQTYVTADEFTNFTRLPVGATGEIETDAFNDNVIPASLKIERETGRRWDDTDANYKLVQRAVAYLTAHFCKLGYFGAELQDEAMPDKPIRTSSYLEAYKDALVDLMPPRSRSGRMSGGWD